MDLLKKQLEKIRQRRAGLSASQKMLTASLVAIMVMTFVFWGRYASNSEMEPVFNSALSADDMNNVKRVLRAEGIPFTPSGDQILVPADKVKYAIANLLRGYKQAKRPDENFSHFVDRHTDEELASLIGLELITDADPDFVPPPLRHAPAGVE